MLSKKTLLSYLPLVLVLLLATFTRFTFLDKVPNAVGGDETAYLLNAKASFLTGHDIFGTWNPLKGLLFQYPTGEVQAEFPYILYGPAVSLISDPIFAAHITNAILGLFLIVFIYLVTKELLGKRAAIFAAFIASINPWLVYIGRTAYEAIPATLFYFISFYILLKTKGWRTLWAFPFLMLAFYSYIGTKIILFPLVVVFCIYGYYFLNKKKYLKQYLSLILLSFIFIIFYFVSLQSHPQTSRLSEILTPDNQYFVDQVNTFRQTTIPNFATIFLANKYTFYVSALITKALQTFSTDYLFISGDGFFSIWRHGMFYFIDGVFLLLGALFIFNKKKVIFTFISTLILIGIIPQVIHASEFSNFSIHEALSFPFLIIMIGAGIAALVEIFKKRKLQIAVGILIVALYIISLSNFLNIYLYWFPTQGFFDFPVRTASSYAKRASDNKKIIIYSNQSFDYFKKYLFYTNSYTKESSQKIKMNLQKEEYQLGNVEFKSCDPSLDPKFSDKIILFNIKCEYIGKGEKHISIANLSDGGENFAIFNDSLCLKYSLNRYPQIKNLDSFNMEKLSNKDFCQTFLTSF